MNEAQKTQKFAEIMFRFQKDVKDNVKRNKSGTLNENSLHSYKLRYEKELEAIGYDIFQLHWLADKIKEEMAKSKV